MMCLTLMLFVVLTRILFYDSNKRFSYDTLFPQTQSFWPVTDSMRMYVKYEDSQHCSQHFFIHQPHITTLRMDKGVRLTTILLIKGGGSARNTSAVDSLRNR